MITIIATVPCVAPPAWAVLERALLDVMDQAVHPFLAKYTREDGTLIWHEELPATWQTRDGADDFYESFYNWPLLYMLGGGDHLLTLALREWEAITKQLTRLGLLYKDYERGYDQFHQSESYIFFYLLCLADPTNPHLVERAQRFAGFYLNEDPDAPNYDPAHRIVRAPHNGSGGPRWGFVDGEPIFPWTASMVYTGLPYHDVPGIASYDDLKDPALARRMGAVVQERMGRGDVAVNLAVTSLVANAYLLTGDEKYRRWVIEYVDTWMERARQNDGLLPDNVGLSGQVGEYMGGKWYGGLYGWTWPHGFHNIGAAATVAASTAFLLSRERRYLDLPRTQLDGVLAQAIVDAEAGERRGTVVPQRYGDRGWFDYQPLSPVYAVALWNLSMDPADWQRIERLRQADPHDWRQVQSFRTKQDDGHEQPWLRFLAGDNPDYPGEILRASYGQVCRRLERIRRDEADLRTVDIHHWQERNPVVTEALIQLTLGAPQMIYYGGLLLCRVRYFDLARRRPGLPDDVAALVERLESQRTVVRLINLSPFHARDVIIQAGAFGEHRFVAARYTTQASTYPGVGSDWAPLELRTETEVVEVEGQHMHIHLPPATEILLDLEMACFVHEPSYRVPWEDGAPPINVDQTRHGSGDMVDPQGNEPIN